MNTSRSSSDRGAGVIARVRRFAFAGVLATGTAVALPALTMASPASAASACPAVGHATDCGVLITINADGSVSITSPADNGNPYDGHDD
ncbi:MAG TPA: hypothetical protein VMU09_11530, partial [Acidimicrobiales bacterium]|nr:hypothetical protein [Acidimicrobiales bacterium]